jgi:hypothetical protein
VTYVRTQSGIAHSRSVSSPSADRRLHDRLTDLSARILRLEARREQLDTRLLELAETESSFAACRTLLRERAALANEIAELRLTIAALRDQAV